MNATHRVIAIDGPAASGKSSVARLLAKRLGAVFINTGAMYRAATLVALRRGLDLSHGEGDALAAPLVALLDEGAISFYVQGSESALRVDGAEPGEELSSPEVNVAVSIVAANARVREWLVARQRQFLNEGDIVMEGRDIGTVVFPETPFKYYIDASLEVRSKRRALQGHTDDLGRRDKLDSSRAASPLMVADGAEVIDSSEMTLNEVVDTLVHCLKNKGF